MPEKYFSHLTGRFGACAERHGLGHLRADPIVPFFQRGQEFAAQERNQKSGQREKADADPHHEKAPLEGEGQNGFVQRVQ